MTASAVFSAGAAALFGSSSGVVTKPYVETATLKTSNTTVGFADSDLYGVTPADIDRTLDEMQAMGVQNVRILIPWARVEPAQDFRYWNTVDYIVNAAYERNMGILGVLNSTPSWAVAPGQPAIAGAPTSPEQFAEFAGLVADQRVAVTVVDFGVLRDDWTPKQSAYVIQQWTATHPQAAPPTVTLTATATTTDTTATTATTTAPPTTSIAPMEATAVPQSTLTAPTTTAAPTPVAAETTAASTPTAPTATSSTSGTSSTTGSSSTSGTSPRPVRRPSRVRRARPAQPGDRGESRQVGYTTRLPRRARDRISRR